MAEEDPCWPCEQEVIQKLPPCPLQCRTEKCKAYQQVSLEGKPIVFVLGGAGSGKTTICGKIVAKYGLTLLVTDKLLKDEVKSKSVRGKCLSKVMERKDTAPGDVMVDLVKEAVFKNARAATNKGFLFDGFPKVKKEAVIFEKRIAPSTVIFYLEATSDTLTKRIMAKDKSANQDAVKHKVKADFETHELLLAAYANKVYRINADKSADQTFKELVEILDCFMPKPAPAKPSPAASKTSSKSKAGAASPTASKASAKK